MDRKTYELVGPDYPGNRAEDVKDPSLGWMIGFLFLIALLGPFAIVILRKVYFLLLRCRAMAAADFVKDVDKFVFCCMKKPSRLIVFYP
jgi:hypothetical protein